MIQLDIKEVKKILYQLEDITELGTKLPVLAFQKLKEFYPNLDTQDLCMDIYKREVDDTSRISSKRMRGHFYEPSSA